MNCQTFVIIALIILVVIYSLPKSKPKQENFRYYDSNVQRSSMLDNQPRMGFLLDNSAYGR